MGDWLETIGGTTTLLALAALLFGFVLIRRAIKARNKILDWEKKTRAWGQARLSPENRAWAAVRLRNNYLWVTILVGGVFYAVLWFRFAGRLPWLAGDAVEKLGEVLDTDPFDHDALRNIAYAIGALLGGTALLAAVPFQLIKTWMNERQAVTAEQGHITDRITKAIEQLGAEKTVYVGGKPQSRPNIEVRLGAIYALERIAQDSERDHIPIMETLCAYLRENAPASDAKTLNLASWEPTPDAMTEAERVQREAEFKLRFGSYVFDATSNQSEWLSTLAGPRADVQAALTVIGRRELRLRDYETTKDYHLDLTHTNLQNANLGGARLEGAYLEGARLEGANLGVAHLEGANLGGAHLERADLGEAHLERAKLGGAHLEGADLVGAKLKSADLTRWHMARMRVRSADFTECTTLTQQGVNSAFGDAATILPDHIQRPDHWDDDTDTGYFKDIAYDAWIASGAPASKTGMAKPGGDGA
ncbi:MAG: pentapeptide repeat-containing protein [Pseudomonadota bacterium]